MKRFRPYLLLLLLVVFAVFVAAHSPKRLLEELKQKHPRPNHNEKKHKVSVTPEEIICHDNTCYPKVFKATNEFQVVYDDQVVPSGLHVRMDFNSGLREAKINDPTEDDGALDAVYVGPGQSVQNVMDNIGDIIAIPGTEATSDAEQNEPRVLMPIQPVKPNPRLTSDIWSVFRTSMEVVEEYKTLTEDTVLGALLYLEDASHEVEFGVKIVECGHSLTSILSLISNDTHTIEARSRAAITLGNSLQNNPSACEAAYETGVDVLTPLMHAFMDEFDAGLRGRIMFAIARVIRIPGVHKHFIEDTPGLSALLSAFVTSKDRDLRRKIMSFLDDVYLNDEMLDESHQGHNVLDSLDISPSELPHIKNKLSQWCQVLQDPLQAHVYKDNGDDVVDPQEVDFEMILRLLVVLKTKYPLECQIDPQMEGRLMMHYGEHSHRMSGNEATSLDEAVKEGMNILGLNEGAGNQAWMGNVHRREHSDL